MSEQRMHELLQRYFDGNTSLTEEAELRNYFSQSDIPESLYLYQPLFTFFTEERAVESPKAKTIRISWIAIAGIAASIAIVLVFGLPRPQSADAYVYLVDGQRVYDESAALASAENKMQQLAASFKKAQNSMASFEKVQSGTIALQQIGKVQEAYQKAEEKITGKKQK